MVRIATVNDAEQLNILNDEFNGESETSIDNIRNSLMNNKQEVVIVADEDDMLVGFVCVQLKKSFCYDEYMPEITEVYVKPAYRKRGLASEMITFAEAYCSKNYPLHQYELLTGQENLVAQTVYNKLGYVDDNELHLSKRVAEIVRFVDVGLLPLLPQSDKPAQIFGIRDAQIQQFHRRNVVRKPLFYLRPRCPRQQKIVHVVRRNSLKVLR